MSGLEAAGGAADIAGARSLRPPLKRAKAEDSSDVDIARPRRIVAERRARARSASGVRRGGRTICLSGVMMMSVVSKI